MELALKAAASALALPPVAVGLLPRAIAGSILAAAALETGPLATLSMPTAAQVHVPGRSRRGGQTFLLNRRGSAAPLQLKRRGLTTGPGPAPVVFILKLPPVANGRRCQTIPGV